MRVMQWNVHGWRDSDHMDNIDRLVQHIKIVAPDVLVLNEVLHPYTLPAGDAAEVYMAVVKAGEGAGYEPPPSTGSEEDPYLRHLARETGLLHYHFGAAVQDGYFGRYGYGNAILSRTPLQNVSTWVIEARALNFAPDRRIEAENRVVLAVDVSASDGNASLTLTTTHLDQLDELLREQQMTQVLKAIEARVAPKSGPHRVGVLDYSRVPSDDGVLFVGDLNTYHAADYDVQSWAKIQAMWALKGWGTPPEQSPVMTKLQEAGYRDAHSLCGVEGFARATCWVTNPLFRVDYMMLNDTAERKWAVESIDRVDSATCSDHYPIVMDMCPK